MPTGVIINVLSVVLGGWLGSRMGGRLSERLKQQMTVTFGVCALAMGISSVVLMRNMPAVIFAVIIGTLAGTALDIDGAIRRGTGALLRKMSPGTDVDLGLMVTAMVLFCASGTGIYGSMTSGMTGDHSILIAKSILDLPTSMIFACTLGVVVSAIALPQFVIFLALFLGAKLIFPLTTPAMINDFKACGGFIMLATGFRIIKVKQFPIADMIPAMLLVMPLSWLWSACILPLLG